MYHSAAQINNQRYQRIAKRLSLIGQSLAIGKCSISYPFQGSVWEATPVYSGPQSISQSGSPICQGI